MRLNSFQFLTVTSLINNNFINYRVTADLEINDYPMHARRKVIDQEFLCSITDMTNAEVKLRGIYVDPKSKVPPGNRKLYLHFMVNNKNSIIKYRAIVDMMLLALIRK